MRNIHDSDGVLRVLLLLPATSYRGRDFLDAARRLGVAVIVGSNHRPVLAPYARHGALTLNFAALDDSIARIVAHVRHYPVVAIVGTDEETIATAAAASQVLGLPHNAPEAVAVAQNKYRFRTVLAQAGLRSPWFTLLSLHDDLAAAATAAVYPCVLKPLSLSASRGVIRADDPAAFVAACHRIAAILQTTDGHTESIVVEGFIPGREVALEGVLHGGRLQVLAIFDKPDPLDGPFFEETLYVTPSRLAENLQDAIVTETAAAARALGLREGPVHAEVRLNAQGAWMIELAARSIGGICSRTLVFAPGVTLEEVILRHALGLSTAHLARESRAAGVMMLPIPKAGRLRAVTGLEAARRLPGVEDVILSMPIGTQLLPLPEGGRYLGFLFARADTPQEVGSILRQAHQLLRFDIESRLT